MANDMVVVADKSRTSFKIGLQHAETVLNFVTVGTNIQDPGSIIVLSRIKISGNGIISIVFFFFFNNRSIYHIAVLSLFTVFTNGGSLNKPGYIIGTLLNHLRVLGFKQFLCSGNLRVPDVTLVFQHFPGETYNNILLQLTFDLLFPVFSILLQDFLCQACINGLVSNQNLVDLVIIQFPVFFLRPVKFLHPLNGHGLIVGLSAVIAICKDSFLHNSRELFHGLGNNICPLAHGIVFTDSIGPQAAICTIDEFVRTKHIRNFVLQRNCAELLIL